MKERKRKKRRKFPEQHPGPGIWDDFAALFDSDAPVWSTFQSDDDQEAYNQHLRKQFQAAFRLTPESRTHVFNRVRHLPERPGGQPGNQPLKAEVAMAAAMWYLATGQTYREVCCAIRQGLSQASVMRCVRLFTEAVVTELMDETICFPSTYAGLKVLADAFFVRSLLPGIIGCIDGSHIKLSHGVPVRLQESYHNRKGAFSIVLHAVVDPRGLFMDIATGYPGRMGDSNIMQLSSLWTSAEMKFGRFGFCLYGDAAYPLLSWLLTGYRNRAQLTTKQLKFNNQGSRARVIVECDYCYSRFFLVVQMNSRPIFACLDKQVHSENSRASFAVWMVAFARPLRRTGRPRRLLAVFFITLRFSLMVLAGG